MPKLNRCIFAIAAWAISMGASPADDLSAMPFDQPPLIWLPTNSERVRKELKISDEQREKIQQLAGRPAGEWKPEELKKQLAEILTAMQLNRLQQIARQVRPDEALRSPEVSEAIGITKDQREQIDKIWQDGQASL